MVRLCRRKMPALRCSSDFLNGTPMLSLSASSAYGSASDKSGSCRRVGHLVPAEMGPAGTGLLPCAAAEYGYTHICPAAAAAGGAVLPRSCSHVAARAGRRSLSSLDAEAAAAAAAEPPPGAAYERPGVTVECRVDCRHTGGGGHLLPPPPPPVCRQSTRHSTVTPGRS